jgi:undecaprenyl-phosphate 4-deoxy-4-formamido-L-arabinose transferase
MLSFVIPCYRSENTVGIVVEEILATVAARPEYDLEIILVNDGSPDHTASAIKALAAKHPQVVVVDLSRNFGQHSALMAGFHHVRGDIVICLDDDGQTPACECFKLIDKVLEGHDIVFAEYGERKQSAFRNLGSRFNAACNHFFFAQPKELKANSYFACRRFVVDSALQYPNPFPYVTGLLFQSVGTYCNVPVEHKARLEGKSGYNLKKLISLWFNGITAFSIKPLRLASYIGWVAAVAGFLFAVITIIRKIIDPAMQAGWASTVALILIMGGLIIALIGIVGEYIGRIYLSINRYPQFVVREVVRGSENAQQAAQPAAPAAQPAEPAEDSVSA